MKRVLAVILLMCMLLPVSGCGSGTSDAREVLENYIDCIKNADYETAYGLLSGFDRGNIDAELFRQWQTAAAKLSAIESYEVDKKVDRFKNYEYMGAKFPKAFGFRVSCKRTELVAGAETEGYDSKDYRIMVAQEGKDWKVALLLTDLEDTVKKYQRQLEE